ncbi:GTP-binding protein GEM-like [Centruroides sculpturatus]|uniref:GTP-binding protein GEM-like n=1 Tax=Centruroides sculpturatus TaxID=218467 RepID=UPI000C6ED25F|nr:GTP-binding protein GEM-like [Centruroides sculpturatus]XP_023232757.1 GTP-binding protein GEM-like [Centruroides sculpturatus]
MSDKIPHLTVSAPDLRWMTSPGTTPVHLRPDTTSWKRRSSEIPSSDTHLDVPTSHRLRSFSVTGKGVVCLGNHLIPVPQLCISPETIYRVLLIGSTGVGKTSLVSQFLSSDFLTTQESLDDCPEKTVTLMVDGVESKLVCVDCMNVTIDEECLNSADAFVVVYSVTDRSTYNYASRTLSSLSSLFDYCPVKAVIIVGNKVDLVRGRTVSSDEGRTLANRYDTKYIETSALLNHNVDELLVGIVSQIRLKAKQQRLSVSRGSWSATGLVGKARDIMDKILQKCDLKARSCDDLNVI